MEKVGVVILNYLNYKDTIECIESIKSDIYENKEIVVVDNGSSNESWEELNKLYKGTNIHLIRSDENLGFAKGNNIGIRYATNKLNCKFVLVVNNDTIFEDSNLLTYLMKATEENVAVIGPRIISADKQEQNPTNIVVSKESIAEEYRICNSFRHKFNQSEFGKKIINNKVYCDLKSSLKKLIKGESKTQDKPNIHENCASVDLVLHGSCMMLTEEYFKYYPELFPETFLYFEENILTLLTRKVGLKKKFINNCYIYHKEDQSSQMSFNNLNKIKAKFHFESMAKCEELFDLTYEEIIKRYFKE